MHVAMFRSTIKLKLKVNTEIGCQFINVMSAVVLSRMLSPRAASSGVKASSFILSPSPLLMNMLSILMLSMVQAQGVKI